MLCLSRKPSQKVPIGDEIVLTIVRITPGNVRIGIEAPLHVKVVRQEIADRPLPGCTCRVECRDGDTRQVQCEWCRRQREGE